MIEKILNTKRITYSSNLNGDKLKQKIEDIFEQSNLSFVGKFTSPNEFSAYDKRTSVNSYGPNIKSQAAYLNGEIIKSGKSTLIKLNIKPNLLFSIFPILTILIGLITIIVAVSNNENNKTLISGIIIIAVGILFYLLAMLFRNRLRNNFKKYLDLQKV